MHFDVFLGLVMSMLQYLNWLKSHSYFRKGISLPILCTFGTLKRRLQLAHFYSCSLTEASQSHQQKHRDTSTAQEYHLVDLCWMEYFGFFSRLRIRKARS